MSAGSVAPKPPAPEGIEVVNFGCRLNLVEGEAMRRAAVAAGRRDLAIVNTCGVTGEAVRQARQTIRRLKREAPARGIVVTGCAAEMEPGGFSAMPEVDGLVGNGVKTARETWLGGQEAWLGGTKTWLGGTADLDSGRSPLEEGFEDHTRAFLAVQNGCDHRCTFCAIPFGRGVSRSAPLAEVTAAAVRLVDRGFHEIVLTGVDLTSYGADLPERPVLGTLVRAILESAPGLARLRLSSIDCIEADAELLAAFAGEERLMPYLHLSLQSGDDMILKRMKRRHTRADAVALCEELRRLRPDMTFGADLIAGFPTETEDMAAQTLALIEDCGLTFLHVFPFSPRPGTPAAKMPPVPSNLVRERARRLREAGDTALRRHLRGRIGRTLLVLAERGGIGRAPDFTPVSIGRAKPGSFTKVAVAGHDGRKLFGKCLDDI
jgi:threonylcarbamoyladenosine tRNA methylthiotransferase MtaB